MLAVWPVLGSTSTALATALSIVLILGGAAALWWRRRHPVAVLLLVVIAQLATFVLSPQHDPGGLALAFAVYAVSVYGRSTVRLWVAGFAIAGIVVGVSLLLLGDYPAARSFIPAGAASLVGWVIGDYIRSRRQYFMDVVARHQEAREHAAEHERLRIARELHDVVAHNVSAIAIQAGAARVSGTSGAEALRSIENSARSTIAELNRLLGVLRKGEEAPDLTPQPTLDSVDALLKPARDAGLQATLKVTGVRRPVPAAVELSAYRVIQEAITNVLKHASATRVEIRIDFEANTLVISVKDNGRGNPAGPATSKGHGLIGMRERVELVHGELATGTSPLGGFGVRARLPLT